MKKTLFSMLVMAAAAFAAESDQIDWTFTNYTTKTDDSVTSALTRFFTSAGIQFSITADSTAYKATASESDAVLPGWLFLDSVTLHEVDAGYSGIYGILCDSTGNVVTVSDSNASCAQGGALTFNFSDTKVEIGEKYEVIFFQSTRQSHQGMLNWLADNNWSFATDSTQSAYTGLKLPALTLTNGSGSGYTGDGTIRLVSGNSVTKLQSESLMPAITITAHTPEPATATLSLLALAGLAARRRRH